MRSDSNPARPRAVIFPGRPPRHHAAVDPGLVEHGAAAGEALGIPWDAAMLSWAPGRRDTDGPWAPHWYKAVETSTGFSAPESEPAELPEEARRLADRCRPYYERLAAHRLSR